MEQTNTKGDLKESLLANNANETDGVYFELGDTNTKTAPKEATYTKNENAAITILGTAVLFLLALIGYIFYTFKNGALTQYCKDPSQSCTISFVDCCGDDKCYNTDDADCVDESKTIAAFFGQLLLIGLLAFKIYTLIQSLRKGTEIYKPQEKEEPTTNKLKQMISKSKELKEKFEDKKINCRKYAYTERETPQATAVYFIKNSILILSCLNLLQQAPEILINIITGLAKGDDVVGTSQYVYIGVIMLITAISNILTLLFVRYCCHEDCCCYHCWKCCINCLTCRCCCQCKCCDCSHFPEHHVPYVKAIGDMVKYSASLKLASAFSQIYAIVWITSTSEWDLWLTCFNFVSGVLKIFGVIQLYWRYFYLLCFYWTRMAVNRYESYKIHELLQGLLGGAYVFKIEVKKEDEFVRVDDSQEIAKKVWIKWDCFTGCLLCYSILIGIGIGVILWWTTGALGKKDLSNLTIGSSDSSYNSNDYNYGRDTYEDGSSYNYPSYYPAYYPAYYSN